MALAQADTRAARIERQVDSWMHIGLAVLGGYVLASWVNHVPILQQKAAEVPQLKHQVVVEHTVATKEHLVATKEHARAVNAEKDRDYIVKVINGEAAAATLPEPKPKPD